MVQTVRACPLLLFMWCMVEGGAVSLVGKVSGSLKLGPRIRQREISLPKPRISAVKAFDPK